MMIMFFPRARFSFWVLALAIGLLPGFSSQCSAVTDDPNAPEPPPRDHVWTPLDHLAFDPKVMMLPRGFSRGKTVGKAPYIAHRFIDDVGGSGWGWIKVNGASWNSSSKWAALKETPGVVISPSRSFVKPDTDLNYEYELWGYWADYTAYDARTDERLPVFVLVGWRVIGLQPALDLRVGLPSRRANRRSGTGAASRASNPILTDPAVD